MSIQFKSVDAHEWQAATRQFGERHFMHAWQWGELQENLGRTVERRVGYIDTQPVAVVTATVHAARRGRYLEVGAASLLDWNNNEIRQAYTQELRAIANTHGCVFVRVRPQLRDSTDNRVLLTSHGWKQAPMHLHAEDTSIIDLTPNEDELLRHMRQQTRYEVRKADKQGIRVAWSNDTAAVNEFYAVQQETAERQGFVAPSKTTLTQLVTTYGDKARIYKATTKDNEPLAYGLVVVDDIEAVYYEAASTPAARKAPGAYALQWQAMRDMKQLGCERYNLWGIAPKGASQHRYSGVTTFKRGFGGEDVHYVTAHDLVVSPLRYRIVHAIETIRKKKRGL